VIAPPRFVRCNSTSPLVIVSAFSAKAGTDSAGEGDGEVAETGAADADALGEVAAAGELLVVADGDGAATIGAGGGKCVAV
jgi:hypothetical protein